MIKNIIISLFALLLTGATIKAQQKYALLIAGDYKPGSEIPDNDKWNGGVNMDPQKGYDEYWNDTYLMWELLYDDPVSNFSDENITVLFAEGIDYTFPEQNGRYKSSENYDIDHITDGSSEKTEVISALDALAGINEEDYLVVWIMSSGGETFVPESGNSSFVYLWGYDPSTPNSGKLFDYELKAKLDLIPARKKVVIVQAPHSDGFKETFDSSNEIFFTSDTDDIVTLIKTM